MILLKKKMFRVGLLFVGSVRLLKTFSSRPNVMVNPPKNGLCTVRGIINHFTWNLLSPATSVFQCSPGNPVQCLLICYSCTFRLAMLENVLARCLCTQIALSLAKGDFILQNNEERKKNSASYQRPVHYTVEFNGVLR